MSNPYKFLSQGKGELYQIISESTGDSGSVLKIEVSLLRGISIIQSSITLALVSIFILLGCIILKKHIKGDINYFLCSILYILMMPVMPVPSKRLFILAILLGCRIVQGDVKFNEGVFSEIILFAFSSK